MHKRVFFVSFGILFTGVLFFVLFGIGDQPEKAEIAQATHCGTVQSWPWPAEDCTTTGGLTCDGVVSDTCPSFNTPPQYDYCEFIGGAFTGTFFCFPVAAADTNDPTVSVDHNPVSPTTSNTITITGFATDSASRINEIEVLLDLNQNGSLRDSGEVFTCPTDAAFSSSSGGGKTRECRRVVSPGTLAAGDYQYAAVARDAHGNTGFTPRRTLTVTASAGPPNACFSINDSTVVDVGDTVTLNAACSSGTISTWTWDFGDGNSGSGNTTTHIYTAPGTGPGNSYNITLDVTGPGGTDSTTRQIIVNPAGAVCNNNNTVEGTEQCDGIDLDTETCQTIVGPSSMDNPGLACTASCTFDTSGCTTGGFTVGGLGPLKATTGTPVPFTASVSVGGADDVTSCDLIVGGTNTGTMAFTSGAVGGVCPVKANCGLEKNHTFTAPDPGVTVVAQCVDTSGNTGSDVVVVNVSSAGGAVCGNGTCETGESILNCSGDCSAGAGGTPGTAGNPCVGGGGGTCDPGLTCNNSGLCDSGGPGLPGAVIVQFPNPIQATSFTGLINTIIDFIFTVAVIVAPILLVIAGVIFMTAAGDPSRVALARRMLLWTIVGFGIILISKGLVEVLRAILGV